MNSTLESIYQNYLLPASQHTYLLLTLAALLLVLLILCRLIRRLKPIKVFTNDAGRIHVSRGALSELVNNATQKVHAVRKPRICFYSSGGRLHLCMKIKLVQGHRLGEATRELQQTVTRALEETFNLEKIGKIDIIVTGFRKAAIEGKHLPPAEEPVLEEADWEDPSDKETFEETSDLQEDPEKENK